MRRAGQRDILTDGIVGMGPVIYDLSSVMKLRVEVQMTIRRKVFSLYAAEDKGGYRVGDFIKYITAKDLDKYRSSGGFAAVVKKVRYKAVSSKQ